MRRAIRPLRNELESVAMIHELDTPDATLERKDVDVTLRAASPGDVAGCAQICYEAFRTIADRHGFPPDFPDVDVAIGLMSQLFGRHDIYIVVAEAAGRIVGSNFLWEGDAISGIGPITVDPHAQNIAVGRRLMEDVLRRARERGAAGVRLVQAAYHNRSLSLYSKLGFAAREPLSTLQGPAIGLTLPGRTVRPAQTGDLAACSAVCLAVHGHDRATELLDAVRQRTATVVEYGGRVTGYATMVGFFGHAVGETNEDVKALIGAATAFRGPGFLLPTRNGDLLRWCLEHGLRVIQPMTLMTIGLYNEPEGAFLPSILY
jgi:GNAT superfamily N-acetyltransferase